MRICVVDPPRGRIIVAYATVAFLNMTTTALSVDIILPVNHIKSLTDFLSVRFLY